MKKYEVQVEDENGEELTELLHSLPYVKGVKEAESSTGNEITNSRILQSMEDYESGRVKPTPCSLAELKDFLDAHS